ncbi:MAG: histidinol dehydrogenase [Pseudomonadota bacterium]
MFTRVLALEDLTRDQREHLMTRSETDISDLLDYVTPLTERVRLEGDAAVRALTLEFDKVDLGDLPLKVTEAEFDTAEARLEPDVKAAIELAIANIVKVHEDQLGSPEIKTNVMPGVTVGERILPLQSAALYVPRGKGSFPSVVMMLAIPAKVAGVEQTMIITPPGRGGEVDDATLFVARRVGVSAVYRVGGVQGVAAVAHGTESIPKALKVLGPGNSYVTAAKRALSTVIDPGIPAGPSEAAILVDDSVDPRLAAHDMLIEAEHGPDSCVLLVATSEKTAQAIAEIADSLLANLPEQRQAFIRENFKDRSRIVWTEDFDSAVNFVNAFAAEHLEILTEDPEAVLPRITNAGEIMLGSLAPITLGNFVAGSNAILPTGGLARSRSCLGVPDFQKRSSFVHVNQEGFDAIAPAAVTLAEYEGFPAHAAAVKARFDQKA